MSSLKLPREFYERDDVVGISRELIGKVLCTKIDGVFTSGIIVESEAYHGRNDRACHAFPDVKTPRTSIMYGPPGFAYVYLCYGIHHLFNVVANKEGLADAVLIRAVQPVDGVEFMMERRGKEKIHPSVGNGPGILSQALGITTKLYGSDLLGNQIWIEDRGITYKDSEIISGPRVGVAYAGEDANLPWRFSVKNSKWVSK
ncbi:MAG: DNA-3-methyladenine glycosylase [Balneolaceae bacterium]